MKTASLALSIVMALSGCSRESRAFRIYKEFAGAMRQEKYDQARAMATDGAAQEDITFVKARGRVSPWNNTAVQGAEYVLENEEGSSDGKTVTLTAVQRVILANKAGRRLGEIRFRHKVVVVNDDGAWKIDSFEEEELAADGWRKGAHR